MRALWTPTSMPHAQTSHPWSGRLTFDETPPLWNRLCSLAAAGLLLFVGGGPNCRTWSILRWFPKPNAPRPVSGRSEQQVWGLPANTTEEQLDTDNDSRAPRDPMGPWHLDRCLLALGGQGTIGRCGSDGRILLPDTPLSPWRSPGQFEMD